MALGEALWSAGIPSWDQRGSFLLLNPRLPAAVQERVLAANFPDLKEHVWVATSGTGGRLKVVALSRSALEASAAAVNKHLAASSSDLWLNPLPTFHVGGLGIEVRSALAGAKRVTLADWNAAEFVRRANEDGVTLSSLVPTQVHDLVAAGFSAPASLRAVVVGGGALEAALQSKAAGLGWPLLPSYGLTEAASQVATAFASDAAGPWLPLLEHVEARAGEGGVLELRGPSLMTGCMIFDGNGEARWEDPKHEGWYRTGDRGELRGRELRVVGRVDDLVKIRGELVDVAALERALQRRVTAGQVVLRCVADERLGAALQVAAESQAAADEARRCAEEIFPPYARPTEVVVRRIERTALGKVLRS
jgi:O-succinylbenzoic acid--CoA ligase